MTQQPLTSLEKVAISICNQLDVILGRTLGAGAHKHVFLINQAGTNLALKIAPVSATLKSRFERESQALLDCHHPAIASLKYVKSYVFDGEEYWVTIEEFLAGGTLRDRMVHGPMPVPQLRHIGTVLADALVHLHERGLVHRDIKPENILFRDENEPVLTDFGIVRVLGELSLTQDFMAQGPGTPLYSAPEQLLNDKASIDWRTDQFDLALVLVECVLGHHAFFQNGLSRRDAILAVANRASLPRETEVKLECMRLGCLIKALAPWPVQRYRWPEEFIKALSTEPSD